MKEFDWRLQYAPQGYQFVKHRISFETLERAFSPSDVILQTMETMAQKFWKNGQVEDLYRAHTRISVFPKEIGEDVNHLDPLKPRFGIEIEIRQPVQTL